MVSVQEDELRPRFQCRVVHREMHAPFQGFNRAQAAVIEAAILVSRLGMLPREKVEEEIGYLQHCHQQDRRSRRAGSVGLADGRRRRVLPVLTGQFSRL